MKRVFSIILAAAMLLALCSCGTAAGSVSTSQDMTEESVAAIYREMEKDRNYCTFVAEDGGKIVGLAAAVKVLAVGHPGGYIKMNGIGVLPEYRHQGIGQMLMERVEALAVESGAPYVGLASGLRRAEAHAFYRSLGYRETSYWFRKNLA